MSDSNEGQSVSAQPSFAELTAALKALQQPSEGSLTKNVGAIIVAASIGIGGWVLFSLNSVQSTLARVDATMTSVQSSTLDTSRRVDSLTTGVADTKAQQALLDQRMRALEAKQAPSQLGN